MPADLGVGGHRPEDGTQAGQGRPELSARLPTSAHGPVPASAATAASPWRRVARATLGVAGLAFVALALARTVDRSQGVPLPGALALGIAVVLVCLGLVAATAAWAVLLGPRGPSARAVAHGFLGAQLGKYVPGAVWQAVGQVDAATLLGVPVRRGAAAFGVAALLQVAGAALIGSFVALAPVAPVVRLAAGAALVGLLLIDTRPLAWVLRRIRPAAAAALPAAPLVRRSFLLGLGPQLAFGLALTVLVAGTGTPVPWWTPAAASLAWAAGFVVLPLPAGLGVRETVLLAALAGHADPAAVLTASLALRLASIVAELLCWVGSRPLARRHRRSRSDAR